MVARLTPDQKAACSNHVGVSTFFSLNNIYSVFAYHILREIIQQINKHAVTFRWTGEGVRVVFPMAIVMRRSDLFDFSARKSSGFSARAGVSPL